MTAIGGQSGPDMLTVSFVGLDLKATQTRSKSRGSAVPAVPRCAILRSEAIGGIGQ